MPLDVFKTAGAAILSNLGEAAVFTPAAGDAVALKVNVEDEIQTLPDGFRAGTWSPVKTIEYLIDDVGRQADRGETFTVNDTVYTVKEVLENDGIFCKVAVK